jgi:hypothetical protein
MFLHNVGKLDVHNTNIVLVIVPRRNTFHECPVFETWQLEMQDAIRSGEAPLTSKICTE